MDMTTSWSNGQTVDKLMDMLKMYIGYVNPDDAALVTIQADDASSQTSQNKKKRPADRSCGYHSVKRQRTKDHGYESTLDSDEEANVANIMMSPRVQDAIANVVKTALLNSAQKADVSKAPEHLETHFE
jgi:hypothetical protein